jgi:hypothetical protein
LPKQQGVLDNVCKLSTKTKTDAFDGIPDCQNKNGEDETPFSPPSQMQNKQLQFEKQQQLSCLINTSHSMNRPE